MGRKITAITAMVATALAGVSQPAMAQTASGMGDLIGARAPGAETQLQARGYQLTGNKGGASMWWNASTRTCVSMFVDNGRAQSIQTASASDCGKSGGSDGAAAAIAGIAAIGLIAALSSHHKNSPPNHADDNHDSEYQRGYSDALYGGGYARNDSEGYHEGYMAGETERTNRLAANRNYGRGAAPVAMDACARRGDDYLGMPRGTSVPVSSVSSGGGNYQVTVAAGHYRARCNVTAQGYVIGMNPY